MKYLTIWCLSLFLFGGCQTRNLDEKELSAYVVDEGNKVSKSYSYGTLKVSLTYWPQDLIIAKSIRLNQSPVLDQIDSLSKQIEDNDYFVLSFSNSGQEALRYNETNPLAYSNAVNNLAFRLEKYVSVTDKEGQTIPIAHSMFQRTFGLGPSTSILIVLVPDENQDVSKISWQIRDLGFGIPNTEFEFDGSDLKRIPNLDYNAVFDIN